MKSRDGVPNSILARLRFQRSHRSLCACPIAFGVAFLSLAPPACSPIGNAPPAGTSSTTRAAAGTIGAPIRADVRGGVLSTEPWTFNDRPGEILTTAHYRIYSTDTRPTTLERLPLFLETALEHFRTAITGADSPLPYPELRMESFILGSRQDWEVLTRQLLGEQATVFLRIRRGGFAYAGRALLFNIGTHDTMAVSAHEGWHQYTQRTFRQPLPIWLEEGLAAYMEGHRWGGSRGGQPIFLPWANVERFDYLRRSYAADKVVSLTELLSSQPQSLISATNSEPGLTYYAQVWALAHFLCEGAGGRYRTGLQSLLRDAAAGRIAETVAATLGSPDGKGPLAGMRRPIALNVGPVVFLAYFNQSIDEAGREYRDFVATLVQPGSRGPIVAGTSPFETAAPDAGPR